MRWEKVTLRAAAVYIWFTVLVIGSPLGVSN
jgi:hypothetical protein